MKYIYNKIFYFLVLFLFFSQSERQNANAYNINFGPATYTNGSYTETLSIPCNGTVYLRSGGSITFQVSAFGDILEYITLSASPLPPGATFPTVSGGHAVQSTFSWTQESSFTGTVNFLLMPYEIVCSVIFDWPLPVELSSFNSVVYGNDVTLNWTTASEINNSGFDIERKLRTDEISGWIVSGSLPGNGNSNVQNNYTFTDLNLNSGTYQYRLKQTDFNGSYEYFYLNNDVYIGVPEKFSLQQNYPNPFNPVTNVEFGISKSGFVSLKIHDMLGKEVATLVNENFPLGYYTVKFDGSNLSSGVYLCIMKVKDIIINTKMILMK